MYWGNVGVLFSYPASYRLAVFRDTRLCDETRKVEDGHAVVRKKKMDKKKFLYFLECEWFVPPHCLTLCVATLPAHTEREPVRSGVDLGTP